MSTSGWLIYSAVVLIIVGDTLSKPGTLFTDNLFISITTIAKFNYEIDLVVLNP